MALVHPLITIASLLVITLAYRWFRGVPVSKGPLSASFGVVAFAGAAALVNWADDDSSRLLTLAAVLVGVALFSAYQIARRRASRHSWIKPHDRSGSP